MRAATPNGIVRQSCRLLRCPASINQHRMSCNQGCRLRGQKHHRSWYLHGLSDLLPLAKTKALPFHVNLATMDKKWLGASITSKVRRLGWHHKGFRGGGRGKGRLARCVGYLTGFVF